MCAALSKHIELDHTPVTCDCGCTVDPTMMSTHASFECDLRTVACPYCDAHFIERRLREHKVSELGFSCYVKRLRYARCACRLFAAVDA